MLRIEPGAGGRRAMTWMELDPKDPADEEKPDKKSDGKKADGKKSDKDD